VDLKEILVRPVTRSEEPRFVHLMHAHHYLGALPKISETVWYVASWRGQWVALLSFSAAALKCGARDRWIGWSYRHQYDRLKLIANNSRFLILPESHWPNLGSRTLALCCQRLRADWPASFGHPLLLLESFVDAQRHRGTVYQAANWLDVGYTRGFRRTREGYSNRREVPKKVFVYPLQPDARRLLAQPILAAPYRLGEPKMLISAAHMRSLPEFFADISDPRRAQGRRHRLVVILAIAAGAVLCGMRGYKAIADWAQSLSPTARARFGCRRENGHYLVPSEYVIRDALIRLDPLELDRALQRWNGAYGQSDASLAIDGKTMCNALNAQGEQIHIMSVIGHQTNACYTQKKSAACP
jgi:hypothetical protein